MSRHVFDNLDGVRTVVGWDPPMQTFFVQKGIFNIDSDEWIDDSEPNLWLGTRHGEISNVQSLIEINSGYELGITPEVLKALVYEARNDL